MPARAFAIARNGVLLVDTVRAEEGEAKNAAVKLSKRQGVGWKDLQARGYVVVPVTVATVAGPKARPRPPVRRHLHREGATP